MEDLFEQNALYGLQHAVLGVIVLDAQFRVSAISQTAEAMLGLSGRDLLGKSVSELHPQGGAARIIGQLEQVRLGATGSAASLVIPVPGRLILLKIACVNAVSPDADGGFVLSLLDAMDVSRNLKPSPNGGPAKGPKRGEGEVPHLVKLPIETPQGVTLLDLNEVVCLTASGRYAEVKTKQGRPRMSGLSLKDLEDRLDPTKFLRVHRAHMVNMAFANSFHRRGDSCELVMADEEQTVVPIGRSRVPLVRGLLGL